MFRRAGAQCVPWPPSAPKGGGSNSRFLNENWEEQLSHWSKGVLALASTLAEEPCGLRGAGLGDQSAAGAWPPCCGTAPLRTHSRRSSNVGCNASPDAKVPCPRPSELRPPQLQYAEQEDLELKGSVV